MEFIEQSISPSIVAQMRLAQHTYHERQYLESQERFVCAALLHRLLIIETQALHAEYKQSSAARIHVMSQSAESRTKRVAVSR